MDNLFDKYTKDTLSLAKKIYRCGIQHQNLVQNILLILASLLLLIATIYSSYNASNYFSTDSDAMIATQQFSKGLQGHPITLPGAHSNLLVIPLLYIQGHLPYHYTSFTLVNISLVVITVVAWAYLLIKLFGRKYEILILILLSSLMFTSVTFNLNIAYTTIRNIEYPIALWFVYIVSRLLKNIKYTTSELIYSTIGTILFCIVLAGDTFFKYAVLLPILSVIAFYWVQSRRFTLCMLKVIGLLIGVLIGATLLKTILAATGILIFDNAYLGASTILPFSHLAPSIAIALQQLLKLQGSFIFGHTLSMHNLAIFMNFGLLTLSVVGFMLIIRKATFSYKKMEEIASNSSFIFVVMAVSYFIIFIVYILSGYVVTTTSSGQLIDWLNTRYISFMPLISSIGLLWLLKTYYKKHKLLLAFIPIFLIIGMALSYQNINTTYKLDSERAPTPSRASIINMIDILKSNNVHEVITDYWYGSPIRFWSNNSIGFAPQIGCNHPLPFASRQDWFVPKNNIKSALIIDRGGVNYGYWGCTNQQLLGSYGNPIKIIVVPGITPLTHVDIWIYNYDVRQHLLPYNTVNKAL